MSDTNQFEGRDPQELLSVLAQIKAAVDTLNAQKELAQAELISHMQANGLDSLTADLSDGKKVKGTLVQAERVIHDEAALEAALGPEMWAKVTRTVLDKDLLEAHVTTGAIPLETVDACSEVKPNKPFVKVGGDVVEVLGMDQAVTTTDTQGKVKPALQRVKARRGVKTVHAVES